MVMDAARLCLDACIVRGNMGPGAQHFVAPCMKTAHHCCLTVCCSRPVQLMRTAHATGELTQAYAAGVDVSDCAVVEGNGGAIRGNVGGVWLWQSGRAKLDAVSLEGSSSYVILADSGGMPTLTVCGSDICQDRFVCFMCVLCAVLILPMSCGRAAVWRAAYTPRMRRGRASGKTATS